MQTSEAEQIRLQWGDKPCDHPNFVKEYHLGAQTGDRICTQCGHEFLPSEVEEIIRNRE